MKRALLAVALLLLPGISRGGEPLSDLAESVIAGARRARLTRIAVLPLEAHGGAAKRDGEILADRLTERLVADGRLRVVERSRLADVMAERRLGELASQDATGDGAPRLETAEALVTGSCERAGAGMRASVRLVSARTGEILAAAEETVAWDEPADASGPNGSWTITVPAPEFLASVPPLDDDSLELRDAPNEDSCANAAGRVDRIAEGILDLKARFWASELRKGFSPYAITKNPGSEISDPALKERFYGAMKSWYKKPFVPELSPAEIERLRREDGRAAEIASRCGI
ncbi:MAG: hypothetical protein KGJ84_01085 [Elusimicrobia bacterium]|nr:hypothetical protein [Elusimicrobiota bacterium]